MTASAVVEFDDGGEEAKYEKFDTLSVVLDLDAYEFKSEELLRALFGLCKSKLFIYLKAKALSEYKVSVQDLEKVLIEYYVNGMNIDFFVEVSVIPIITENTANATHNSSIVRLPVSNSIFIKSRLSGSFFAESQVKRYNNCALGGTFDHLHYGHKILLTIGVYCSIRSLIVGISADELLKNKKFKEGLESFDFRKETVTKFVHLINPELQYHIVKIVDVYGPTATEADLQGLIVSEETISGAIAINNKRKESNMNELEFIKIGLIPPPAALQTYTDDNKLSSTALRKFYLAREKS